MNLAETFRGLARRWYIVGPGLILAVLAGLATWSVAQPGYERTATQILLPGVGTLPEEATNPYLYLGGVPAAADVLVRAVGSEEALRSLLEEYPGTEIEVARDPSTSGPVMIITVTATSDADAAAILDTMVERTAWTLAELQQQQGIPFGDRISVSPIAVDGVSTLQQRTRIVLSIGVGAGIALLSLLIAGAVDGLLSRSRRGGRSGGADGDDDTLANEIEQVDETHAIGVTETDGIGRARASRETSDPATSGEVLETQDAGETDETRESVEGDKADRSGVVTEAEASDSPGVAAVADAEQEVSASRPVVEAEAAGDEPAGELEEKSIAPDVSRTAAPAPSPSSSRAGEADTTLPGAPAESGTSARRRPPRKRPAPIPARSPRG